MENNKKENKPNYVLIVLCVLVAILIIVLLSKKSNTQFNRDTNPVLSTNQIAENKTDLGLQTKCSEQSSQYFKKNVDTSSKDTSFTYTNHWNKKLNKCFVQVNSNIYNQNGLFIDIFDAFEGKRYAAYLGCTVYENSNKCKLSSGSIWYDGNDTRNPADYQVGFEGSNNGPRVGDENTLRLFTEEINKNLMSN